MRKISNHVRTHSRSALRQGREAACNRQWLAGMPVEDSAELPLFDKARHPGRRIFKERPVGSKRQFPRAVADNRMRLIVTKPGFIEASIARIAIGRAAIAIGFA